MRHVGLWDRNPGVRSHHELSRGERSADRMKAVLATWAALIAVLTVIAFWVIADPGFDRYPYILLNLCLSCFAALQCFVLLIANKRGEQIAAEIAEHTLENTNGIRQLLEENTELTRRLAGLGDK